MSRTPGRSVGEVVILGAGMGGLFSALALAPHADRVVVLERDPPPPAAADEAFSAWPRRGAPQLRHTHAFRARMTQLLRRELPDLLRELEALGARQQTFAETLPADWQASYRPSPADDELTVVLSRRATFELALHRQLARCANVELRTGVTATGLLTRRDGSGGLVAEGFTTHEGPVRGDIVIDAGGRASPVADWLAALGELLPETGARAGIVYYTQFYRLHAGGTSPGRPAVGDLGCLKYGAIPADGDAYSITLAIPEDDLALRQAAVHPTSFARLVSAIPAAAAWSSPQIAASVGRPAGMADLKSRWRVAPPGARPTAANLFLVGDSLMLSNPLHGRGCTFAAVEAFLLRDAVLAEPTPTARARRYARTALRELRAYFEDMQRLDREAAQVAAAHLGEPLRPNWWAGLRERYRRDGLAVATRRRLDVLRRQQRCLQLLDPPARWRSDPRTVLAALDSLIRGRRANAAFYPAPGPTRAELLQMATRSQEG